MERKQSEPNNLSGVTSEYLSNSTMLRRGMMSKDGSLIKYVVVPSGYMSGGVDMSKAVNNIYGAHGLRVPEMIIHAENNFTVVDFIEHQSQFRFKCTIEEKYLECGGNDLNFFDGVPSRLEKIEKLAKARLEEWDKLRFNAKTPDLLYLFLIKMLKECSSSMQQQYTSKTHRDAISTRRSLLKERSDCDYYAGFFFAQPSWVVSQRRSRCTTSYAEVL